MTPESQQEKRFISLLKMPMYLWCILFVFVSLLYVFGISFCTRDDLGNISTQLTLGNYERLFSPIYLGVLLQSLKQAVLSTILCVLIGFPFGYLMSRFGPKGRGTLLLLIMVPFWTSALIRIYGWRILLLANGPINSFLLKINLIKEPLKLLYTNGAVQLGMVYALLPFMILPSYSACEKLDINVIEAARDLGASPLTAFLTVTVPLAMPGLLAGCVLVFIPSMGMFFLNDLLGGSTSIMIGSLIQRLINSRDLPMAAALSMLLMGATGAVLAVYGKLGGSDNFGLF